MHVICGFKTGFASQRDIISILCRTFKSFFSASNKQVDSSVFYPASSYQECRKTLLKEQFLRALIGLFGPQVEAGTVQKALSLGHIPISLAGGLQCWCPQPHNSKGFIPWLRQLLLREPHLICQVFHSGRRPLLELSLSTQGQGNNSLFMAERKIVNWDKVIAVINSRKLQKEVEEYPEK